MDVIGCGKTVIPLSWAIYMTHIYDLERLDQACREEFNRLGREEFNRLRREERQREDIRLREIIRANVAIERIKRHLHFIHKLAERTRLRRRDEVL